jgi:hypothetical protein|tara:strand:- start:165 stop:359 length:195 start_codon:yes stop_codon:yes gene_type:complete
MELTSEQIIALKNVLFLAEEVVHPDYNPFHDADDVIAHNSIELIRELITEQENIALAKADSEDS